MSDPFSDFTAWLDEAKSCTDIKEPTAMCLATADDNCPSARMVLLKGFDRRGFVFYTNFESRKGSELEANPQVALCFYWQPIGKQVRIEGDVEKVSSEEADAYFATRSRDSQLGAWASAQSRSLKSREQLEAAFAQMAEKFADKPVPRPPYWSGWRVVPDEVEFWQEGAHRLHDRVLFSRHHDHWHSQKLYP